MFGEMSIGCFMVMLLALVVLCSVFDPLSFSGNSWDS